MGQPISLSFTLRARQNGRLMCLLSSSKVSSFLARRLAFITFVGCAFCIFPHFIATPRPRHIRRRARVSSITAARKLIWCTKRTGERERERERDDDDVVDDDYKGEHTASKRLRLNTQNKN